LYIIQPAAPEIQNFFLDLAFPYFIKLEFLERGKLYWKEDKKLGLILPDGNLNPYKI